MFGRGSLEAGKQGQASTQNKRDGGKGLSGTGIRVSALARDVATMGSGTLLNVVFSTALVFLVPRMVSVEDYGYWRLFTLYAGYVGFLHLGFADGALLRWAGKPLEEFHHEIGLALKLLVAEHLLVIAPACLLAALLLPSNMCLIAISVLLFALVMNSATLLQFSLQGGKVFGPVAVATAAPTGAFLLLVFLWELRRTPNFRELIVMYFLAWAGVLVYLWMRVKPVHQTAASGWRLGRNYISLGWPILLANTGYSLVGAADRFAVSAALPIYDFAQYSLAASIMFVPVAAIATVYRVFFSHVAGVEPENRAKLYGRASKFVLVLWGLLLPSYFAMEPFVRHFLPKYAPALPVAGILLVGVFFLAGIQILHMSYFYLHGMGRQFLVQASGALTVSFSLALVMAVWLRSLMAVAIGQVIALGLWWIVNEWSAQKISGQSWKDWLRVLGVFGWATASFVLALHKPWSFGIQPLLYYGLTAFVFWVGCQTEVRFCVKFLTRTLREAG